jgi:hypothetical protein
MLSGVSMTFPDINFLPFLYEMVKEECRIPLTFLFKNKYVKRWKRTATIYAIMPSFYQVGIVDPNPRTEVTRKRIQRPSVVCRQKAQNQTIQRRQ